MLEDGYFTILDTVDSTNNYAMGRIHDGMAKHGMAWFAKEQTAGKGQRGKTWTMEKAKNIVMSLVVEPNSVPISSQFHLSAAVALTCFEFFNTLARGETTIKWPNDLYWRDRKAGGILIENVLQGKNWKWAVIGIGININQTEFPKTLFNPVSLKQVTGLTFDSIDLAKQLCDMLMKNLLDPGSMDAVIKLYNAHLYKINKKVSLKKDGVQFDTVIKEVSAAGRLITADSIEKAFDFGEVEWVL